MTVKELRQTLQQRNKGLAYEMYKQAGLVAMAVFGKIPDTPEKASPELYPPKKTYKMSDWMKERYYKQEGVIKR